MERPEKMRFSIIIPVYNVEKYIGQCMESVMNQSFRDYEVIVVDDESPDGSMKIVEKYADADPERLRIVHQKNTRQGGARNHGVSLARGEYLIFVDSDDYVSTDMLATVDRCIRENPADILVFGHYPVTEDGKIGEAVYPCELPAGRYVPKDTPEVVMLHVAPWEKAFRREFYVETGFQFPEKVLYEDGVTRLLYGSAQSMVLCREAFYYYRIRENSTMRQKISPRLLDILTVADLVLEQFRDAGLYDRFRETLDVSLIYSILCVFERINEADPQNPLQNTMAEYLEKHFPDYWSNPYVSAELRRELDCLKARRFRWYRCRYLRFNRRKEAILYSLRRLKALCSGAGRSTGKR